VFLSEVAHRAFSVKFSGLTSELRILENHIKVREYSTYTFIFGLFLKVRKSTFQGKKDLWCADEAFRIILFKRHHNFWVVINIKIKKKNSIWQMLQLHAYVANDANESTRRLVEDGMSTSLCYIESRFILLRNFHAQLGCRLAASRLRKAALWRLHKMQLKCSTVVANNCISVLIMAASVARLHFVMW